MQEHFVRRGRLPTLVGELDVERHRLRPLRVTTVRVDDQPRAGRRVELDHELVTHRAAVIAT